MAFMGDTWCMFMFANYVFAVPLACLLWLPRSNSCTFASVEAPTTPPPTSFPSSQPPLPISAVRFIALAPVILSESSLKRRLWQTEWNQRCCRLEKEKGLRLCVRVQACVCTALIRHVSFWNGISYCSERVCVCVWVCVHTCVILLSGCSSGLVYHS